MPNFILKRGLVIGIIVLIIGLCVNPSSGGIVKKINHPISDSNTLYVGGSGPSNYTRIQDAIDNASNGDTIFIYDDSSPYYENVYLNKKNIKLIGENSNSTIIDEGGDITPHDWALLADNAHGSTVCNLTLQNVTTIYGTNYAFMVMHSDNMKIINCRIRDSISGLLLFYSKDTTMRNNRIENNTMNFGISGWAQASDFYNDIDISNKINGKPMYNLVDESDMVLDGIDIGWLGLINCTNITVKNVNITGNTQNILIIDTKESTICNCKLYNSSQSGIQIGFDSDNNDIDNCPILDGVHLITNNDNIPNYNTISNCNITFGVGFQQSSYNSVDNCNINLELRKSGVYNFIAFSRSDYNTISNCTIYNNTEWGLGCSISFIDVFDPHSNYNNIINNTFYGFSGNALELLFDADYNNIIGNRFINSSTGIYISSSYDNEGNRIYHNTFIDNSMNAYDAGNNYWNNNYPSGGNYWDDYEGIDKYRGQNQDQPGSDGIGDTRYDISGSDNKDYYPLMYEWGKNPPLADFSFIIDNLTVIFNASSSYDRDGIVTFYKWDFGDNYSGSGKIISHTYEEKGIYNVSLTVTDDDGNQGIWSQFVIIGNQPPNPPKIDGQTNCKVGIEYEYNFSISDPDGDLLWIHIDWEHGTPSKWDGPFPSGSIIKYNYSWRKKGIYTIRAQTRDSNGLLSTWGTLEVTIPRTRTSSNLWIEWLFERFPLLEKLLNPLG